jgi:MFS transporter, FHS family, glucose/mannose:H+ symporter
VGTVVSGPLMSWRGYRLPLVLGYALIGVGLAELNANSHVNALLATTGFGVGYGLITPGTNLFVAELAGAKSASVLNLLNVAWGAGAMACSPLIALALRHDGVNPLLYGYAVFGATVALALAFTPFGEEKPAETPATAGATAANAGMAVTIALAVLFFIYVSTETAIGVWSAEYTRRVAGTMSNLTTLAPMFFYAGLTTGRGVAPAVLMRIREQPVVLGALTLTGVGVSLLIASVTLKTAIAAVFLAGLGCACIYPIYIAWLAKWFGARAKNIGAVLFGLASVGGSVGPALVGFTSKVSGSLRVGLAVPFLFALIMFGIVLRLRRQAAV